jgi:ubiquinone/menaquinone biosynthesis C-methylase UbiE
MAEDQRYVIDESVQHGYVGQRDVVTFLPFLVPHLNPGVDVVDVGCGVGAIALDVAARVAPGRVLGVDADAGQIETARASAAERGAENASFEVGSVYELPVADASADVVYANAVLFYVPDRPRALAELRRVLKPGGLAAVVDDYLSVVVLAPELPAMARAPELFERIVAREGGDTRYSANLRRLLLDAGFARTRGVAHAPETYGDAESTRWFAEFAAGLFSAASTREVIVAEGWADEAELEALVAALREWGERPDAFATWLYCGALGWVD